MYIYIVIKYSEVDILLVNGLKFWVNICSKVVGVIVKWVNGDCIDIIKIEGSVISSCFEFI